MRSSVSADISKHTIWVCSTDFKSTVKAVKIHERLISYFGYDDGCMLEEGNRGQGISITVCGFSTVRELQEDYAQAKREERDQETTEQHREKARTLLAQLND